MARDPKDITRADPNFVGLAQDYSVTVELGLKGDTPSQMVLTLANKRGPRGEELIPYEHFRPLAIGSSYVLFLRKLPGESNVYVVAFEPSRFIVEGASVVVQSPWDDAPKYFPTQAKVTFLQSIRNAVAADTTR